MGAWVPITVGAAAVASIGGILLATCVQRKRFEDTTQAIAILGNTDSLATTAADELSVVSYNVLADTFASRLDYASEDLLSWQRRWPMIKRQLLDWQADIVCLQEVDVIQLPEYLQLAEAAGYAAVHQETRGKQVVCMTLFKTGKLQLWWQDVGRSRTLLAALLFVDSTAATQALYVANCHLEGSPHKPQERLSQLRNSLAAMEKQQQAQGLPPSDCHMVVCGDLNSGRKEGPVKLLSCGWLPAGYREEHAPKQVVVLERGGDVTQPYLLADAYQHHPLPFTRKVPALESVLDWLFASTSLTVTALLWPLDTSNSADRRLPHSRTGLPNALHPSDHLPIGAKLRCLPAGILQQ